MFRVQKPLALGSILLATYASAAQIAQVQLNERAPDNVLTSSTSAGEEGSKVVSKGLLRKEQVSLAETANRKEAKSRVTDLYVNVGQNLCDGGTSESATGLWKRYELTKVKPAEYKYCAAACDDKDECVGFDMGNFGCNLYTQKAVALGTWPSVRFNDADAFDGQGEHNKFPAMPVDLVAGTNAVPSGDHYQCYRKTFYKPADSYYWLIGHGTCSGGGMWKRYVMTPGDFQSCEHACNMRDECIGFDVGVWQVSDATIQVFGAQFDTTMVNTTGCFMYTQKAVYGTWPLVQDNTNLQDGDGDHDDFPATPYELSAGYVARFEVGNLTKCYGKTHWVGLDQYFMLLGKEKCSGGGFWRHYKMVDGTLEDCKDRCDMKDSCVGLDYSEGEPCRLFTRLAVSPGSWHESVHSNASGEAFAGQGTHDKFAQSPYDLIPLAGKNESRGCYAKTHFETTDQILGDSDN
jgi:hypothetical protein